MGGAGSPWYTKFKSYCCEANNILRKASNLILNLFSLMAGANIPDLSVDTEKALLKLLEKFRLDLSDEDAVQYFQTLINESVRALFPQVYIIKSCNIFSSPAFQSTADSKKF